MPMASRISCNRAIATVWYFGLFVPADDLFADAEPARKSSLRHSLGDPHRHQGALGIAEHATQTCGINCNHQKNPYLMIKHLINRWVRLITEALSVGLTKGDQKCFVNYSPRTTAPQRRS
jgi:hypothetical protein